MLVLSRRCHEGIRIGDDVRVIVVDARPGNVRLGIEAPEGVKVWRDEIYESIVREREGLDDVA